MRDSNSRNLQKGTRIGVIIIALFALYSCSGYYHIKQAEKHTQKALNKGVTVERDTTYLTKSDTLTEIDTVDNYIKITKTIKDTVYLEGKTVYIAKSRTQVRQEEKTKRVEVRNETKREKVKQKQTTKREKNKTRSKNYWWLWMLFGGGIVLASQIAIRKVWR